MKLVDWNKIKISYDKQVSGTITEPIYNIKVEAPTVEAIPVEWIGKWWDKQPLERDSVFFLLRDWERETGIDAEQHAQAIEEMRSRRTVEKENETN